jgi:hypothetical protein
LEIGKVCAARARRSGHKNEILVGMSSTAQASGLNEGPEGGLRSNPERGGDSRPGLTPDEEAALKDVFTYQPQSDEANERMREVRVAGLDFATVITLNCPRSADRSAALRKIREACFTANAAIALEGRNLL